MNKESAPLRSRELKCGWRFQKCGNEASAPLRSRELKYFLNYTQQNTENVGSLAEP